MKNGAAHVVSGNLRECHSKTKLGIPVSLAGRNQPNLGTRESAVDTSSPNQRPPSYRKT